MKIPLSWLKEYVDINEIDISTYSSAMTMSGTKVEGNETLESGLQNIVTGKVIKIEKHPNADKLVVCLVDIKERIVQIVTGAQNLYEGAIVPVAKHRSVIANSVKITKGKLRGVLSEGMLCSQLELGVSTEASGIMILPPQTEIGQDINKTLNLEQTIIEFEITYNRPDCLSIIGLARETAATFGKDLKLPKINVKEVSENIDNAIAVEVSDTDICHRFCARVLRNIKIAPSDDRMQNYLRCCGVRPINNVVDVTNYVMLEYGQPMHAYDLDKILGKKIVVKSAEDGEIFETLDGQSRKLNDNIVVISDESRTLGIAGIMGGANTGITADTHNILLESAVFDANIVAKAAASIDLHTEASLRFERGVDAHSSNVALDRACQLLCDMSQQVKVLNGMIDIYPHPKAPITIPFNAEKINKILGYSIEPKEMLKILNRLDILYENGAILPPSFRSDITLEVDIVEEIARIYGYEKIPTTLANGTIFCGSRTKRQHAILAIKKHLAALGLFEIITYSFADPRWNDKLLITNGVSNSVSLVNAIGYESGIMATSLLGSMLETLKYNYNQRNQNIALFTEGKIYFKNINFANNNKQEKFVEKLSLAVGLCGKFDFYDLKGIIVDVLENIGAADFKIVPCFNDTTFHPGRCAKITLGGITIATIGQLHPTVTRNFDIPINVYAAEVDLETLLDNSEYKDKRYQPLPKFPSVSRDISIVLDEKINVSCIEDIIKIVQNKTGIIENYNLFDFYQGDQIEHGKKSVAYSVVLRAPDRTLTDAESTAVIDEILDKLKLDLNAEIR